MASESVSAQLLQDQIKQLNRADLDEAGRAKVDQLQSYLEEVRAAQAPTFRERVARSAIGGAVASAGGFFQERLIAPSKRVKYAGLVISMALSIAAFALLIQSWLLATGFIILLLIHELGHVIQLRREGIKSTIPMFIPFLGAVVIMKEHPGDAATEARVGLAGPVLGSIACLVPLAIYLATGSGFWRALAILGFFINLFNLLPVPPLDGGRAVAAISPYTWIIGLLMLLGLFVWLQTPLLALIALIGGVEAYNRIRAHRNGTPEQRAYFKVSIKTKLLVSGVYLLLLIGLVGGMLLCRTPTS